MATIPGGNTSERAVPKIKKELAADPADHFIDFRGPGISASIFCFQVETRGIASGDFGRIRINAGYG